jgi:hypothetical protein
MAKAIKKNKNLQSVAQGVTYEPSEMVIKEIMHQKNCGRDEALKILKNPTPHPESTSQKKV